jgi:hypothetical protein
MSIEGPMRITVNITFPNKRAYDVAWAIAKLSDYEDLDEYINDAFMKTLEMYPEGSASLDMEEDEWGFKSRWQKRREEIKEEQAKTSR